MKRFWANQRASFTLEAALIVPALFVILFIFHVIFYDEFRYQLAHFRQVAAKEQVDRHLNKNVNIVRWTDFVKSNIKPNEKESSTEQP